MNYDDPRDHQSDRVKKFLERISAIESSSGKDVEHPVMENGIHKDTAAVGEYGLMPNTAIEMANRYDIPEGQGKSAAEIQIELKGNPELAKRIAESMASGLLNKNDEESANYMWEFGHNKEPDPEKVKKADRTRKFRVLKKHE